VKIWGTAMVRNEADIIEAFVRHNLARLDGLVVVDHGSADATNDILLALCREKLPLVVMRNDAPGYLQPEIVTETVRTTLAKSGADFVFPLDADEFLKCASRDLLERALASLPPGMHGQVHWLNYVPALAHPAPDVLAALRGARRAVPGETKLRKVVVARAMLDRPAEVVGQGSHWVLPEADGASLARARHALLRESAVAIAHVPIRSVDQYVAKVAIKKLGRLASGADWLPDTASQAAYTAILAGGPIDAQELERAAANWSVPTTRWTDAASLAWADDPFLASFELRYTPPAAAAPLPLILSAVERMTRRLAAVRRDRRPSS